ncbi:MAG: sugar phosphate isomerase/epimerase [bacterium]|nr:sugar phosphate isomerase/epimerase [bacterium]
MNELSFNTMNRSPFMIGDDDPDLPGQIEAAGKAGFAGFGPDEASIARYVAQGGSVEELADRIERAGMRTFELPTLMVSGDLAATSASIERLVGYAAVLRPDFVQVNVEGEVDANVIEGLRHAGRAFGPIGARLAIEYLPWLPAIKDMKSTRALLDEAGVEGAGVLVDTWHFTVSDDTWEELEAIPLDEIAYVQFDDHPEFESDDLVQETIMRRVMPGEGRFELERFCAVLEAKGYTAPVSCEVLSLETRAMDLDAFARRVFETTAPYWR